MDLSADNRATIRSYNLALRDSFCDDRLHVSYTRLGTELEKGHGTAATKLARKRALAAGMKMKGMTIVNISAAEQTVLGDIIKKERGNATISAAAACQGIKGGHE